jgi:hypothetical protein
LKIIAVVLLHCGISFFAEEEEGTEDRQILQKKSSHICELKSFFCQNVVSFRTTRQK